jgi:hypothetical protein
VKSYERTALDAVYQDNNNPVGVCLTADKIIIQTADEREIHIPLKWYNWLLKATPEQRSNFQIIGSSIYWPDIDEGLSMESVLLGKYPK